MVFVIVYTDQITKSDFIGPYGAMVSTSDFESGNPSSNLGRTLMGDSIQLGCSLILNLLWLINSALLYFI